MTEGKIISPGEAKQTTGVEVTDSVTTSQEGVDYAVEAGTDPVQTEPTTSDNVDWKSKYEELNTEVGDLKKNFSQLLEMQNKVVDQATNQTTVQYETPQTEDEWQQLYDDDPKAAFQKLLDENNKKTEEKFTQKDREKSERERWDTMAFGEFPDLKNSKSSFYVETAKEMQEMAKVDPANNQRPDSVYNAASRVFTRWARQGKVNAQQTQKQWESVEGATNAPVTAEQEITDRQKRIAERFGNSPDVYKMNFKSTLGK